MTSSTAFKITLQPSGKSYICDSQKNLLDAASANGISLRFSCRSGVCRTCRGRVTKGEVDVGVVNSNYLSDDDKAVGYAHLCCAKPLSDCVIEIEEFDLGSVAAQQIPVRIMKLVKLAPDVMQVVLGLPPNEPLKYLAGQYVDILLAEGVKRSYSIASAPTSDGLRYLEFHIRHMPGGFFTDQVFEAFKVKQLLRIEAPLGFFRLDEVSDKPMLLIASGTGFAPIKAMIEHSLQKGMTRPMHIYWGGRNRVDLYMDDMAQSWAMEYPHICYTPVLSMATPDCDWAGRTGLVHRAVLEDLPDLSGFQVYACGAPIMVDAARHDFVRCCALPGDQFFSDSFVSESDKARDVLST